MEYIVLVKCPRCGRDFSVSSEDINNGQSETPKLCPECELSELHQA